MYSSRREAKYAFRAKLAKAGDARPPVVAVLTVSGMSGACLQMG
jgi:hypothetical protein